MFEKLYKNKFELLILLILITVFIVSNPFRDYSWSADHDLLILDKSLKLGFQSINYEHTGLLTFVIYKIFLIFASVISEINSNYNNFLEGLDVNKVNSHIVYLRFINLLIIFQILIFLNKILLRILDDVIICFLITIIVLFSKPILGFVYEIRTDTTAIFLYLFALYIFISKYNYSWLLSLLLSLSYITKINIIPLVFTFPILKNLIKKNNLKNIQFDFFNYFIIFFGFCCFVYYILFFNISIDNTNSLNTHIKLSMFGFYYQVLLMIIFLVLFKLFDEFNKSSFINSLFGISLALVFSSALIDKYNFTLIFNPLENMVRYTPTSDNLLLSIKQIFIIDYQKYSQYLTDNYIIISIFIICIFLNVIKIYKKNFSFSDFTLLIVILVTNFQLVRGHFVRYEIYSLIILIIYFAFMLKFLSNFYKKLVLSILLIISFYLPYNLVFNNLNYQPFISQEKFISCEQGRDWIKDEFGKFLSEQC